MEKVKQPRGLTIAVEFNEHITGTSLDGLAYDVNSVVYERLDV